MAIKDLYECFGKESIDPKIYDVATNLMYRDFITVGLLVSKLEITNNTKIKTWNNAVEWRFRMIIRNIIEFAETGTVKPKN